MKFPASLLKKIDTFLEALINKRNEYSKYIRYLTQTLAFLINRGRFILDLPLSVAFFILDLTDLFIISLGNTMTNEKITNALTNYNVDFPFDHYTHKLEFITQSREKVYLENCKGIDEKLDDDSKKTQIKQSVYASIYRMDDDSWLDFFVKREKKKNCYYNFNDKLNDMVMDTSFNRLKFIARSFRSAITESHSYSSKALRIVAALILVPLMALIQLIEKIIILPSYVIDIFLSGVILVAAAVLVVPLYIKDYIANKMKVLNPGSAPQQEEPIVDIANDQKHEPKKQEEPVHVKALFPPVTSPVPLTPAIVPGSCR